jgi:hypothetical protein
VSAGTLGYIRARNRQRAYDLVIREFKKSGLTQVQLAARLGKSADIVCRLLSRPGNWELNTFSDLMFAISGSVPAFEPRYPLDASTITKQTASSNFTIPVVVIGQPNRLWPLGNYASV